MTRDEQREAARMLLMEFRSPRWADLRRLLEEVAGEEPTREMADRARAAEIGLHGDLRPVPCRTTVMLAIPDWLRPHLYVGGFDASHPEYGYDAEGRESLAIDACLAPAIQALWDARVVTLGCCCGHSDTGHGVISVLAPHVRAEVRR